eukprot:SAG22_NODE_3423_length_1720_cov_1.367057_2_plen_209_part_00
MAGGRHTTDPGGGDADFETTSFAKMGDHGSAVLAPGPAMAHWTAGTSVEVAWGIRFNHGGGYSYRLCPAGEPLTEKCFMRHHLNFTGMPSLRYADGKQTYFKGRCTREGTNPPGSPWCQNPIPRIHFDDHSSGQPASYKGKCTHPAKGIDCRQFDPYACEDEKVNPIYGGPWQAVRGSTDPNTDIEGVCAGDWVVSDRYRTPTGSHLV